MDMPDIAWENLSQKDCLETARWGEKTVAGIIYHLTLNLKEENKRKRKINQNRELGSSIFC